MRAMIMTACVLAVGFGGAARADDKADPTGTWKWTVEFNNQKREQTLVLKKEGNKLTGHVLGRDNMEIKIEDAKLKDGEVTFKVTRERDGQKFTTDYKAKVEGDTMKGTIVGNFGGQEFKREFEAKREKK